MEQVLGNVKIDNWFNSYKRHSIEHGYNIRMRHLLPKPVNTEKLRRAMLDELFED